MINVADKRAMEREHKATIELLRHINVCDTTDVLLKRAAVFFAELAKCAQIEIRLREGCHSPCIEESSRNENRVRYKKQHYIHDRRCRQKSNGKGA